MSPKSKVSSLTDRVTDKLESDTAKKYNFEKDDCFSWIENVFGFGQQATNIIVIGIGHICAFYYCYVYFWTNKVDPKSAIFEIPYALLGGIGTTIGCHRYWSHRTFKANKPLQILLMMMHTLTLQYPIYKWCLDHRIHHKYTDTAADPHNSKRGFWFSHIGWLLLPKTKELKEKLKTFDMPDLENDPIIRFQAKWYIPLMAIFHYLIPLSVYYYFFNMPVIYGFLANCRCFVIGLHLAFSVNSFAHLYGDKPYDKTITPVNNKIVAFFAAGEGWHNYHHTFPWDYRASEFSWKINLSTILIDFFAWIGWAWDLKTVPEKIISERIKRSGDGSRIAPSESHVCKEELWKPVSVSTDENCIWGWDDENITAEMKNATHIINPE